MEGRECDRVSACSSMFSSSAGMDFLDADDIYYEIEEEFREVLKRKDGAPVAALAPKKEWEEYWAWLVMDLIVDCFSFILLLSAYRHCYVYTL